MSDILQQELLAGLGDLGNVMPDDYAYEDKLVTVDEDLHVATAYLKWYNIYSPSQTIEVEHIEESRSFIVAEVQAGRLHIDGQLGFVMLHRCTSVNLLLVTTWRNINELWETVYVKDLTQDTGYEVLAFDDNHKGTFCVWELPVVWHERHAWKRFLVSKRDNEAKLAYINDRFFD